MDSDAKNGTSRAGRARAGRVILFGSQARLERCAIVTADRAFPAYDVPVVW